MGTYLSTPASEKYSEWGEEMDCPVQPLRFALVDMQGWRKSMEDAHVVETKVPYPPLKPYIDPEAEGDKIPKAKIFGVFDGHGGPEVARFCQLYIVSVLTKQRLWQFENKEDARDEAEAAEETDIGDALIKTFHALDRMIDDSARRDELNQLRVYKAPPTERRDAGEIPPIKPSVPSGNGITKVSELVGTENTDLPPPSPLATAITNVPLVALTPEVDKEENSPALPDTTGEDDVKAKEEDGRPAATTSAVTDAASGSTETTTEASTFSEGSIATEATDGKATFSDKREDSDNATAEIETNAIGSDEDYDSDEAVGKEEAADMDQNIEIEESDEETNDVVMNPLDTAIAVASAEEIPDGSAPANKVTTMFQRLLNMNEQQSGKMVVHLAGEAVQPLGANPAASGQPSADAEPSASLPSKLLNGRLICNLPDHPIHAGCTAIVAVMLGTTLTVANAGDSRGVLCREGGVSEPLSFDHKPSKLREMNRINNAGGFVNRFGRVNGNLNLSRSIGDLKYKQVPGIDPADQMITAQPDIIQVTLNPKDEFFILGCDGIWDCLTNEKCVEFVRERIDKMEPKAIGEEMLNTILSDDPRATQGIGGDNMTILIVDLQPASRGYKVEPAWGPLPKTEDLDITSATSAL